MAELSNLVGYTAIAPGNHDFNFGADRLAELSNLLDFPVLAANVLDRETGEAAFDTYKMFTCDDGTQVGLIGLATPETVTKTNPSNVESLEFLEPAPAATAAVEALQAQGADIIVAVSHLGLDESTLPEWRSDYLALNVEGIDIIIDGHSHDRLENGLDVNGVLIASAWEHGNDIGQIDVTISAEGAVSATATLLNVAEDGVLGVEPDTAVLDLIHAFNAQIEELTSTVVGETPYYLNGVRADVRTSETNLANLIADAMLAGTGADIALMNGGGIRDSIQAGPITMGDVLTVLPFSNNLVTIDITGQQLIDALEWGVRNYPDEDGGFIHVGGLTFDMNPAAEALSRVSNVKLSDGTAIDVNARYTVATLNFLADGGDGYTMLADHTEFIAFGSDFELFSEYLRNNPVINQDAAGRMNVVAH